MILIDDDSDELELMQEAIEEFYGPVNCTGYRDPEEALKTILSDIQNPPDVIFIDINMPKLTGDMCLQVLRKELALDKVVIAMLSTHMETENIHFLMGKGADFAFRKPAEVQGYRQIVLKVMPYDKTMSSDNPGSFF
ncbi:MAG: response regulator [Chryseolinea sp.]